MRLLFHYMWLVRPFPRTYEFKLSFCVLQHVPRRVDYYSVYYTPTHLYTSHSFVRTAKGRGEDENGSIGKGAEPVRQF